MLKKLILIVGLPGSGKSFAAFVIKKHFHAQVLMTGDVIREEIKRRGLPYNTENDIKMRLWFHTGREHLVCERLIKKMRKTGIIVIDGLRSPKELSMFRKIFKDKTVLIKITSSFNVRARREIERGRFGKNESVKYVRERDKSELSELVGLKKLLKMADYTIDNSKLTKKQMENKVVGFMKKILNEQNKFK